MREIKFRGKNIRDGRWVYGNYVENYNSFIYPIVIKTGLEYLFEQDTPTFCYQVIPETVGRYTGLKDKNGVEIFEGDILNIDEDREEFGTVIWDNDELEYQIDCETRCIKLGIFHSVELEIVSNIHESEGE